MNAAEYFGSVSGSEISSDVAPTFRRRDDSPFEEGGKGVESFFLSVCLSFLGVRLTAEDADGE